MNNTRLVKGRPSNRFSLHYGPPADQSDPDTYRPDLFIEKLKHSELPLDSRRMLTPVNRSHHHKPPARDIKVTGRRRPASNISVSKHPFPSLGRAAHHNSSSSIVGTLSAETTPPPFNPLTLARESESKALDVGQAISLLEELKKIATPEELVALHKALLPSKRVEPVSGVRALANTSSSRSRADLLPGIATRGGAVGNLLRKPGDLSADQTKQVDSDGNRIFVGPSNHSSNDITALDLADASRPITPSEQLYRHTGVYRHGTLRIMNGAISPEPSVTGLSEDRDRGHARKLGDHVRPESPERRFTVEVLSGQTDDSRRATHHRVLKSEQARWHRRPSGERAVPPNMGGVAKQSTKSTPVGIHDKVVTGTQLRESPSTVRSHESPLGVAHKMSLEYASECLDLGNPYDDEDQSSGSRRSTSPSDRVKVSADGFLNHHSQDLTTGAGNEKIVVDGAHRTRTQRSYDSGYGSDGVEQHHKQGISGLQLSARCHAGVTDGGATVRHPPALTGNASVAKSTEPALGSTTGLRPHETAQDAPKTHEATKIKAIPSLPRIALGKLPDLARDVTEKGLTSTLAAHFPRPVTLTSQRSSLLGSQKPSKKLQKQVPADIVAQRKYTCLQAMRNVSPVPSEVSACSTTPTAFLDSLLLGHVAPVSPGTESPGVKPFPADLQPRASLTRSPATFDATCSLATPKKKRHFLRVRSKSTVYVHGDLSTSSRANPPKDATGESSQHNALERPSKSQQCQACLPQHHTESLFETKATSGMNEEAASKFARKKSRDLYCHDKDRTYDMPRTATPRNPVPVTSARTVSVEDRFPDWQSKSSSPVTPMQPLVPQRSFSSFAESIPPMPELPDVSILEARKVSVKGARKMHGASTSPTTAEYGTRLHGKSPLSEEALAIGGDEAVSASNELTTDRSSRYYSRQSDMRKFACSPLSGGSSPRPSMSPQSTPEPDASKVWWVGRQATDNRVFELDAIATPATAKSQRVESSPVEEPGTPTSLSSARTPGTARANPNSGPRLDMGLEYHGVPQAVDKENIPPRETHELYSSANSSESSVNDGRLSNYENAAIGQAQLSSLVQINRSKTAFDTLPSRQIPHRMQTKPSSSGNDVLRRQIEHERAQALARLDANNQAKHLHHLQPQKSSDVPFNRYSGGLGYGWDPAWGFSGSAGTRDERSPTRIKADSKTYGLDLTDVPVFLRKVT